MVIETDTHNDHHGKSLPQQQKHILLDLPMKMLMVEPSQNTSNRITS